jgi:hypothetical protein
LPALGFVIAVMVAAITAAVSNGECLAPPARSSSTLGRGLGSRCSCHAALPFELSSEPSQSPWGGSTRLDQARNLDAWRCLARRGLDDFQTLAQQWINLVSSTPE